MNNILPVALLLSILAFPALSYADSKFAIAIPAGTVLPVQLSSSVKSNSARTGQKIIGEIMQDVPLPAGSRIPRGAKVVGHVVAAFPANSSRKAEVSLRFEAIITKQHRLAIATHLRAIASMMAVSDAQVPDFGPDRGTPPNFWTTDLTSDQVDYRGGGPITQGNEVVGYSTPGGVLLRASAIPGSRCHNDGERLQAFWLFSSYACGVYDYGDLVLVHAGRTEPRGQITIRTPKGNVNLRSGSGLLLRVQ